MVMKLMTPTSNIQVKLGRYCRTGIDADLPGVTPGRIHHYRRLVFNVVYNTMEQAYPLTHQVFGTDKFREMVHEFFSVHDCQSPQIWKLPGEFYEYALEQNLALRYDSPWLHDLLLFEWVEIEVHTMPDQDIPVKGEITGDPLNKILRINPEFRLIRMEYPVHLMNIGLVADNKGSYFVLVCREPDSGHVNFFNLSILHAFVFEQISGTERTIRSLYPEINRLFGIESEKMLDESLRRFTEDLIKKQVILNAKST